jgi:hypothetical protein
MVELRFTLPYRLRQPATTDDITSSTTIYLDLACPHGDIITTDVSWNNYGTPVTNTDSGLSNNVL